jgi:hypothetical protein
VAPFIAATNGGPADPTRRRKFSVALVPRAQDAELVALGIGQHDPADVALPDVGPLRAARLKPLNFGLLVVVGARREVDVQPVLQRLGLSLLFNPC